jgi:membrane associated rhomboid family serine protease
VLLKALIRRLRGKVPAVTLMLAASCLLTTLPQLFAGEAYDAFTGAPAAFGAWWCWTLPWFSHSPEFLVQHLCGNLAVLLSMGLFIEAVLGSRRFALVSLTTLLGTSLLNILRNGGVGHGASGIFWGYHAFALLFLIAYVELRGRRALRDALSATWIVLFAFDFAGISALEVLVMKRGFFDNFGQTSHLASVVLALPFALAWRRPAEEGLKDLIAGKPPRPPRGKAPIAVLAAICAWNAASTAYALAAAAGIESVAG